MAEQQPDQVAPRISCGARDNGADPTAHVFTPRICVLKKKRRVYTINNRAQSQPGRKSAIRHYHGGMIARRFNYDISFSVIHPNPRSFSSFFARR
jgi:hypothetical protein